MKGPASGQAIDLSTANGVSELEAQVQCRLSGQIHDFRLLVTADGLILQGHAQTYHAKQLAQHAVMAATRLPIQANQIVVA